MFVDACAIIAVLSDEPEAERVSRALAAAKDRMTSPVAVLEATRLALSAAHRYRAGRHGLNLGDCLHYACAKFHKVPILATDDEFRHTDLETVP